MPDGGKIIIATENVTLDQEYCRSHLGSTPGKYVQLSISDTGHGMSREILEHIFEPFYSTKEVGKGTGLGLSMVYGIVKNHHGYITCESEPKHGTTFKIYLLAIEQEEEMEEVRMMESSVMGGTETILLVDDEELIRDLGVELLGDAGYTVLTATDGFGALELYLKEHKRIDLIILDLIIPGIDGGKCLTEILKINPQARVIILSGYPAEGSMEDLIEAGAQMCLSKPYDVDEMLKVVREVLDKD
jgi:CheY-like chemotaxis protein